MLDTIRLTGSSLGTNLKYETSKFVTYRNNKTGTERYALVDMTASKGSPYRAFYDPNNLTLTVELNPHKILFGENIYNYCQNSNSLRYLVHSVAASFFPSSDCYISRADLGGVQTFENPGRALEVLEQYRRAKIEGARVAKYRHQNYTSSAFYYTRSWSAKVYNKGVDMFRNSEQPEGYPFDLYSTLRFEKTYRSDEFKRLGMKKTPFRGVHVHEFKFDVWHDDFMTFFSNWQRQATPYYTTEKGMKGLLSVIDQLGHLSDVAAMGTVSRTTIYRYQQEKKRVSDLPGINFVDNLTAKQKNTLQVFYLNGFSPYLHQAILKHRSQQNFKLKTA